ncbi:MAG: hypothetical protein ACRD36_07575 [Candidatus Acidiferrum sp.]
MNEVLYPALALIHVFLDNARTHHAWITVRGSRRNGSPPFAIPSRCARRNLWLSSPGRGAGSSCSCACRMIVRPYFPLMSNRMMKAIARPWGLMHEHVTPNKCYATCGQFADATLDFWQE